MLPRLLLAAAALAAVAGLTLSPQAVVGPARGVFLSWADAVHLPLLAGAGYPADERTLNLLLFVPLGAALAALLPRGGWPWALTLPTAVSLGVEIAQGFIPGRIPDGADVLWNGVGGAGGAAVVALARGIAWTVRQRGRATAT